MYGWLNVSLKSMETRNNPKVMSICLSVSDATSLHHCLQEKVAKTNMVSEVRIQVFRVMHS